MSKAINYKSLANIPFEEKPKDYFYPLWRYSKNPVINRNINRVIDRTFNSSVVAYKGGFVGVFRGDKRNACPNLFLGRSKDGIRFEIEETPISFVDEDSGVITTNNNNKTGEAKLYSKVINSSNGYWDAMQVESTIQITEDGYYEFTDVPIVRNLLIPGVDDQPHRNLHLFFFSNLVFFSHLSNRPLFHQINCLLEHLRTVHHAICRHVDYG